MSTLNPLSEAQAGYIAGIIDGEGCIDLVKTEARYKLRVVIRTTSKELADWLIKTTGLGAKLQERNDARNGKPNQPNRLPNWEWRVFTNQALQLLRAVRPYIVIKAQQANWAIEYQSLKLWSQGLAYRERLKSEHLRAKNREYFAKQDASRGQGSTSAKKVEIV